MSRSVSRRAALATAALVAVTLVVEPTVARGEPTPVPATSMVPGPTLDPGSNQVTAPIVDIDTPAEDIFVRTEDLEGASRAAESGGRIELTLAADVLFAFGKADLSPAARATLTEIAGRLRTEASGKVQIHGHTDSIGDDAANLALSQRRAEAVRNALTAALAGDSITFEVIGFGETRPVAENTVAGKDNPQGRARNRRVEIRFDR